MSALLACMIIGSGLGALIGRFGRCKSGACPLTANWKHGAMFGAVLGLMFHLASAGPYQPSKNLKAITEAEFESEVTQAGRPVVVDFYAPWCGTCRTLGPRLDELAVEYSDRIKFVSVNAEQSPALASRFNVEGVPTVLFFGKDGQVVGAVLGAESVDVMRAKLQALAGG